MYLSLKLYCLAFVGEEIAKKGAEPFHDIFILSEIQLWKRGIAGFQCHAIQNRSK